MPRSCQFVSCERNCYGEYCVTHKPRKPIKRVRRPRQQGKQATKWQEYRQDWLKRNQQEVFTCGICGQPVHRDEVTLDHILPRSNRQDLRYVDSNIQPAHLLCNTQKGSKHK